MRRHGLADRDWIAQPQGRIHLLTQSESTLGIGHVVLIVNPSEDDTLRAAAEACVETGVDQPEAMQQFLRLALPRVVVHRRELSSEPIVVPRLEGRFRV